MLRFVGKREEGKWVGWIYVLWRRMRRGLERWNFEMGGGIGRVGLGCWIRMRWDRMRIDDTR